MIMICIVMGVEEVSACEFFFGVVVTEEAESDPYEYPIKRFQVMADRVQVGFGVNV
jgi:hypothetical protein